MHSHIIFLSSYIYSYHATYSHHLRASCIAEVWSCLEKQYHLHQISLDPVAIMHHDIKLFFKGTEKPWKNAVPISLLSESFCMKFYSWHSKSTPLLYLQMKEVRVNQFSMDCFILSKQNLLLNFLCHTLVLTIHCWNLRRNVAVIHSCN